MENERKSNLVAWNKKMEKWRIPICTPPIVKSPFMQRYKQLLNSKCLTVKYQIKVQAPALQSCITAIGKSTKRRRSVTWDDNVKPSRNPRCKRIRAQNQKKNDNKSKLAKQADYNGMDSEEFAIYLYTKRKYPHLLVEN